MRLFWHPVRGAMDSCRTPGGIASLNPRLMAGNPPGFPGIQWHANACQFCCNPTGPTFTGVGLRCGHGVSGQADTVDLQLPEQIEDVDHVLVVGIVGTVYHHGQIGVGLLEAGERGSECGQSGWAGVEEERALAVDQDFVDLGFGGIGRGRRGWLTRGEGHLQIRPRISDLQHRRVAPIGSGPSAR